MRAVIGETAPNLKLSEWVQGRPTNIDREAGRIVLVEVFQVNCPGCFLYALPEAAGIHEQYHDKGVTVIGVATAFEDFDKNTLDNLRRLSEMGYVVGETKRALTEAGRLDGGRLPWKIPFPLAMDELAATVGEVGDRQVMEFIRPQIPDFDARPEPFREQIVQRVRDYLQSKPYSAGTFELYALRGTPSTILVDRDGVLRDVSFGWSDTLTTKIEALLGEQPTFSTDTTARPE